MTAQFLGLRRGMVVKNPPANAGDARDAIPALGRSSGGGNGNPLQYSCLENPMDRGAWQLTVHKVTKSWKWLSTYTYTGSTALGCCLHFTFTHYSFLREWTGRLRNWYWSPAIYIILQLATFFWKYLIKRTERELFFSSPWAQRPL